MPLNVYLLILRLKFTENIGKIRENHVKNNREGAQHIAAAASAACNNKIVKRDLY